MGDWTYFDYALAGWGVAGFLIFTIAAMFQLPRLDKQVAEAARRVSSKEASVLTAFSRGDFGLEIDSSNSGIAGGIGFVMVCSTMAAFCAVTHFRTGGIPLLASFAFLAMMAYGAFHLSRALRARFGGGPKRPGVPGPQ